MSGALSGEIWLLVFYLLPSFVAACRNHHNAGAVVVLNIFLGWTVLGWILALALACSGNRRTNDVG